MRKNNKYTICNCKTRNQLIDALENKEVVIELDGSIKDAVVEEIKTEYMKVHEKKLLKNMSGLSAIVSLASLAWAWPVTIVMGGVFLANSIGLSGQKLKKYSMTTFVINGAERLLFIKKSSFDSKYDEIFGLEEYRFTKKNECPKCGRKYVDNIIKKGESNPVKCKKCNQKIIIYH